VRLWDPASGAAEGVLAGHTDGVRGVCAVSVGGRDLLASAGDDATVRLWDPATGAAVLTIPVYHSALACTAADGLLIVGLDAGILALDVRSAATPTP
jgi:WD40 repeat protein